MFTEDPIRVVVADDSEVLREALKSILEDQYKLNVIAFADGKSALEYLLKTPTLLAFVDMNMPHVGGAELIKNVNNAGIGTMFVAITGDTRPETAYKRFRNKDEAILHKTFDSNELHDVLEMVLKKIHRWKKVFKGYAEGTE